MSCCGNKREAVGDTTLRAGRPAVRVFQERTPPPAVRAKLPGGSESTVTLRLRHGSSLVVNGASGKRYQFHGVDSMQAVDRGDVDLLVATGLFERVWG